MFVFFIFQLQQITVFACVSKTWLLLPCCLVSFLLLNMPPLTGDGCLQVAAGLGDFMGRTHAATHEAAVGPERAAALKTAFENRPMRDIQLEFVFSKCYKEAEAAQVDSVLRFLPVPCP